MTPSSSTKTLRPPAAAAMLLGILVLLTAASCARRDTAGGAEADMGRRYVDAFVELHELEAKEVFAKREALLPRGGADVAQRVPRFGDIRAETWQRIQSPLAGVLGKMKQVVDDLDRELQREIEDVGVGWKSRLEESVQQRVQADVALDRAALQQRSSARFVTWVAVRSWPLWLCGLAAFTFLVAVYFHDRRNAVRRYLNGGKARKMGLAQVLLFLLLALAAATAAVALAGDRIANWLVSDGGAGNALRYEKFLRRVHQLEEQRDAAKQRLRDVDQRLARVRNEWVGAQQATTALGKIWIELRERLQSATIRLHLKESLAKDLAGNRKEREQQQQKLRAQREQIQAARQSGLYIGYGIAGVIGLLTLVACMWLARLAHKQRNKDAGICPLCLEKNTLKDVDDAPGGVTYVCCENPLHGDFRFPSMYQQMLKLCFPTLGHRSSGKTLWVLMLHHWLNQGRYPKNVTFERVQSNRSDEFDRKVVELIEQRLDPGATQVELPPPLIFDFQDNDRWGKSNPLVTIFDYSGEVNALNLLEDDQGLRARALNADGYFYFVDPTVPALLQMPELENFRSELRNVRKVKLGRSIHSPVALCMSKIDLLGNQPQVGEDVARRFYAQLAAIDEKYDDLSLAKIDARHQLVLQLQRYVWPGSQFERQVSKLFGGRCRFFPLTPVGMMEPGEVDIRHRTPEPIAILEPLLWLLHMNGFPVLR